MKLNKMQITALAETIVSEVTTMKNAERQDKIEREKTRLKSLLQSLYNNVVNLSDNFQSTLSVKGTFAFSTAKGSFSILPGEDNYDKFCEKMVQAIVPSVARPSVQEVSNIIILSEMDNIVDLKAQILEKLLDSNNTES